MQEQNDYYFEEVIKNLQTQWYSVVVVVTAQDEQLSEWVKVLLTLCMRNVCSRLTQRHMEGAFLKRTLQNSKHNLGCQLAMFRKLEPSVKKNVPSNRKL